ncbi:MAG: hypothetical protein ACXAB9_07620 [Candidatus Thorarchaeota archaeon]|jgi:tetrahydromethanopterin S-methyltransferase subunit A
MNKTNNSRPWPPVPGDFEVRNPLSCVAICTLGKKLHIEADYSIIGTCKTENIGIERVIINVISNPRIRFVILDLKFQGIRPVPPFQVYTRMG